MHARLTEARLDVQGNVFHQYDSLITGWLNVQPAHNLDEYWIQVEKAKWREDRYFKMMQHCFWSGEEL